MNELLSDYQRAKQRLQELSETEEYRQSCQHFFSEMTRLTDIAHSLLTRIPQLRAKYGSDTARREYASGCKFLHRGFYSPSPVIDQIIVGVKRGNLLKRLTARSNPSFEYGFNAAGQLLWSNQLIDHQVVFTEYLIYCENNIYGITLDNDNHLQTVTEEIFENGILICYAKASYLPLLTPAHCYDIFCEEYRYESDTLQLNWHHFMPPPQALSTAEIVPGIELSPHPIYYCDSYFFEKRDGQFIPV